jgi:hypothetical protein
VEAALSLFRGEKNLGSVRLLGVKASQLAAAEPETERARAKQTRVDAALDAAAGRILRDPETETEASAPYVRTYACACGRVVAEADRAEHEDWHFARGLLRRETEADDARARANENGGSSRQDLNLKPAAKRRRRGRDGETRDVKQKTLFDAFRAGP